MARLVAGGPGAGSCSPRLAKYKVELFDTCF
jgi:hypothetical protein